MKIQRLILFIIFTAIDSFSQHEKPEEKEPIYAVVEEMPEFPGGLDAQKKFVADHIIYPAKAKSIKYRTEVKVYVNFIVNKNGEISEPLVVRSISDGCNEEAIRIINLMPKWKPGKQNSKPVAVRYTIPVIFSLPKE